MSYQTPRRLPSSRPSLASSHINTASSPNLSLSASTAIARKASLNALTGVAGPGGGPKTPSNKMAAGDGKEFEVGDLVDVPGGMHGVCKFIGSVKGKNGVFAGVELSSQYAARGKNDGDVDGIHYFNTSIPGAGIFLPIHRASKRASPTLSSDSFPPTPTTPSLFSTSQYDIQHTPSVPKFSQSVGPGARPTSPMFKPKPRPSLPRPESPFRRQPSFAPTPGRPPSVGPGSLSRSVGPSRITPSPAPGKRSFVSPKTPGPVRPYSRNNSRLGHHPAIDEDGEATPTGMTRNSNGSTVGSVRGRPASAEAAAEIDRLSRKLEERDRQLKEQAASLAEMEASLTELQRLLPADGILDADVVQLRAALREKNEKISMLTAEFDAHRADFRSTIDTLEMASTETERVYEKRIEDLIQEVRELQDRSEDVESVARQLKQLEELVQELEEGLEDARRGEAEARGEVEFLRGEVERGRSELRREREKAAEAIKGAGAAMNMPVSPGGSREVEQRDDEIRGLKAIIHSLSSGPDLNADSAGRTNGTKVENEEFNQLKTKVSRLEREKDELQGLIERKSFREEELEREIERLRIEAGLPSDQRNSVISNTMSERTATQERRSSGRDSKSTVVSWRGSPKAHRHQNSRTLEPMAETETVSSASSGALWCEICETGGHDILNCTAMGGSAQEASKASDEKTTDTSPSVKLRNDNEGDAHHERNGSIEKNVAPAPSVSPLSTMKKPSNPPTAPLPNPYESGIVAGKGESTPDPDKWCALCERDGHDATLCPFEDAF